MTPNIIHKSKGVRTLVVPNGDTSDIIKVVMGAAEEDGMKAQVMKFAQRFKGKGPDDQYDKLEELWRWTRDEIIYEEDPAGIQDINDPAATYWNSKKGDGSDCKSKSLLIYFICRCIGIPVFFEFVSFFGKKEKRRITHVFPVAVLDGGEVVLDAVYERFDQRPPDITRTVRKQTKAYIEMTKIYRVSGLSKGAQPTMADLVSEAPDRAKLVQPFPELDYTKLSEGEAILSYKAVQAKVFMEYFPDQKQYRKQYEDLMNTLNGGLHRGIGFGNLKERMRSKPASGWLSWEQRGFSPREKLTSLFESMEAGAAIGEIPAIDCNAKYPIMSEAEWLANGAPASVWPGWVSDQNAKRMACQEENVWRGILNKDLYGAAPHPLYEFSSGNIPATVSAKAVLHRNALGALSMQSKIARPVFREWIKAGILHQNSTLSVSGGMPYPATPEEAIDAVRRRADGEGIGVLPIVWTAPLIIQLIGAIAAAISAAAVLVNSIKAQRPTAASAFENATQGWGSANWTAEAGDWTNYGGGGSNGGNGPGVSSNNKPLLILGAAGLGLALLSGKE